MKETKLIYVYIIFHAHSFGNPLIYLTCTKTGVVPTNYLVVFSCLSFSFFCNLGSALKIKNCSRNIKQKLFMKDTVFIYKLENAETAHKMRMQHQVYIMTDTPI